MCARRCSRTPSLLRVTDESRPELACRKPQFCMRPREAWSFAFEDKTALDVALHRNCKARAVHAAAAAPTRALSGYQSFQSKHNAMQAAADVIRRHVGPPR